MATHKTEKYYRINLFLDTGCIRLMRAMVRKQIVDSTPSGHNPNPWTLEHFLAHNQQHIFLYPNGKQRHLMEEHTKLLNPIYPKKPNLEDWDLPLLCLVLLEVCPLAPQDKDDLKVIKKIRNSLCHTKDACLSDTKHADYSQRIKCAIAQLLVSLNDATVAQEVNGIIKDVEEGPLTHLQDLIKQVEEWRTSDEGIAAAMNNVKSEISTGHKVQSDKLDKILQKQEELNSLLICQTEPPVTKITMHVRNCNPNMEEYLCTKLMENFNKEHTVNVSDEPIERSIKNALSKLLREDVELISAKKECVTIFLRCRSFESLKNLWTKCVNGEITELFKPVQQCLKEIPGCENVELDIELKEDELLSCLEEIGNAVKKENEWLLKDIERFCNRQDYKKETILLISKIGQGKSSIVNTLIRVFIDEYLPRAGVGKGVAQTKSLDLIAYKCCGITSEDFKDPESPLVDIAEKLFTLMDFAGLADEDSPVLREKLELLIGGRVPLGTTICQLDMDQSDFGVGNLATRKYIKADPNRIIHKVVFAQGCNDNVPKKLINCLQTVLKTVDEKGHYKYKVTVFPMITKYDIVKEEPDIEISCTNSTGMDDISSGYTSLTSENGADDIDQIQQTVTLKDFKKVEAKVARLFKVEGALKHNCFRWVSHCDSVGYDANPHITNTALKFVKRMVSPGAPKIVEPPPVLDMWTRIQLFMSDRVAECNNLRQQNINVSPMVLLMALVGLVVIVFMYRMLADNPTHDKI